MNERLLNLEPTHYKCPFCGREHKWENSNSCMHHNLKFHDSPALNVRLICPTAFSRLGCGEYSLYFDSDYCYYSINPICKWVDPIEGKIPLSSMYESRYNPIVTFKVPLVANDIVGTGICSNCPFVNVCNYAKLGDESDRRHITITLGFIFDQDIYQEYAQVADVASKGEEQKSRKQVPDVGEQNLKQSQEEDTKEATTMSKTTPIISQLYEHSPKENIGILKEWAEKYKPTLQWAVPVSCIFVAREILKSKDSPLNADNIAEECENNLGFSLDALTDKNSLKKLLTYGGIFAGAYAAIKVIFSISNNDAQKVTVGQVEESMNQLERTSKTFSFIKPETDALLPAATSVIIVYLMTQKPAWFDSVKNKAESLSSNLTSAVNCYVNLAKLYVSSRLNLNAEDAEEIQKAKKFALLAAIVGICVFLYGRKILGKKAILSDDESKKEKNEKMEAFVKQLLSIMRKLLPSVFTGITTILVTQKVLMEDACIEVEAEEVSGDSSDK